MNLLDWLSRCAIAAAFALLVLYAIGTKVNVTIGIVLIVVGALGLLAVERQGATP